MFCQHTSFLSAFSMATAMYFAVKNRSIIHLHSRLSAGAPSSLMWCLGSSVKCYHHNCTILEGHGLSFGPQQKTLKLPRSCVRLQGSMIMSCHLAVTWFSRMRTFRHVPEPSCVQLGISIFLWTTNTTLACTNNMGGSEVCYFHKTWVCYLILHARATDEAPDSEPHQHGC